MFLRRRPIFFAVYEAGRGDFLLRFRFGKVSGLDVELFVVVPRKYTALLLVSRFSPLGEQVACFEDMTDGLPAVTALFV